MDCTDSQTHSQPNIEHGTAGPSTFGAPISHEWSSALFQDM